MAIPVAKSKAETTKSGPTPAQRAWVKDLSKFTGAPAIDEKDLENAVAPVNAKKIAGDKEELVGFSPLDIPELIPKGAAALLGPLSATCLINNNAAEDLFLDPQSREDGQDTKDLGLSSGEYDEFPPSQIKGGDQSSKFKAVNVPIPIIGVRFKGVTGRVRYFIGADKKTTWTLFFDNPRRPGGNEATAAVAGANAAKFEQTKAKAGGGADAKFLFLLQPKGGSGPAPTPTPTPTPGQDVPSSCRITVTNNTQQPLALSEQDHERGAFMSFPAKTIPPGGNTAFISVETPNNKDAKDEGCKGFVVWEIGSPAVATWRIEWDNPEGEKNTAKSTVTPQSAGFKGLSQIAQGDENVPVDFTISGGGDGPGPGPVPPVPPIDPPEIEPEFNAPPGSRQPTLRRGDKSPDGWVEYLQVALNHHLGTKLEVDGNFGRKTLDAAIAFQKKKGIQVDGTVGNQTWAALREGKPEAVGTDGRQPHTFEEKGTQARFDNEKVDGEYHSAEDLMLLFVASVGEEPIDKFFVTVRVTPPDTKSKVKKFVIGPPVENAKTQKQPGGGAQHHVKLANFKKTFPAKDPKAKVADYKLEAFFDKELGPDVFRGKIDSDEA